MTVMNYKNTSTSEHAWLFASYRDRWQGVIDRESFGVGKHYAFLKEVQPGDPCVAYVYGEEVFTGWGRVTGGYYPDEIEKYRHRVKLEMKLVKNDVPLHSIRGRLQFVKNVPNLGRALQKGVLEIPVSDYQLIKEALESPPTPTRLQPLMQEGHEKATRNGGIESHAEAEADLLELGNLLGFDTYVTADDRNKEFRGKLLSKTATLQEMPEDCIPPGIKDTVRHIDVIWFEKKFPKYCIEVEHSTDITHGLLRLYRLKELKTSFMVVAPTGAQDKFEREVKKVPFDSIRDSFRFNSYDDLTRFLAVAREFVGEKQNFLG